MLLECPCGCVCVCLCLCVYVCVCACVRVFGAAGVVGCPLDLALVMLLAVRVRHAK